jgi:hypothetical protein
MSFSLIDRWECGLCGIDDRRQELVCSVNTQHNCAQHKCDLSGRRAVQLEREDSGQTEQEVKHLGLLHDRILNTAKLRDARYIQRFACLPLQQYDPLVIVPLAVDREIDTL